MIGRNRDSRQWSSYGFTMKQKALSRLIFSFKNFLAKKSVLFHLLINRNSIQSNQFQEAPKNKTEAMETLDLVPARKILIVGMSESPHLHTWIQGIAQSGVTSNLWLFPSDLPKKRHHYSNINVREFPYIYFGLLTKVVFKALDIITNRLWRSYFLYREINRINPTHLHFHETQHGAYLYNSISSHPKNAFQGKIILSTWGSDLIHYGSLESHHLRIECALSWVDLLTSERLEDLEIAVEHGFTGNFLAPVYTTIGSQNSSMKLSQTSHRTLVLVKGYQDNHGRALNALASIEIVAAQMDLSKFSFRIFSASKSVKRKVEQMRKTLDLNINVLPKMPKHEFLSYYKDARAYLGLAISDGLSTSMVEAMSYGAFPIQSVNSSAPVFLVNRVTGGVVDPYDTAGIAAQLMEALENDELVDQAAIANISKIRAKYNWDTGLKKLVELYD